MPARSISEMSPTDMCTDMDTVAKYLEQADAAYIIMLRALSAMGGVWAH